MFIFRDIQEELLDSASRTPVVILLGPRQSGKTTLVKMCFPEHTYINLEDLETRQLAQKDPKSFIGKYLGKSGIIVDEAHHAPELFSLAQVITDENKRNGLFIFTGSQNLALNEKISQSLAGRVAELTLMPLSVHELLQAKLLPQDIEELVFKGGYPRLYTENYPVNKLYKNYIKSYIERDVRQIKNISNLSLFQDFMIACASRTGQQLNLSSLSEDLGISQNTVKSWLSVLQASYIIFLLKPYYRKYGKRITRTPKLYFTDTDIACSLLGINNSDELFHSYLRGPLIETCILSDIYKQFCNKDIDPQILYYWRNKAGLEIDAIIHKHPHPIAIEIKTGKTVSPEYFKNLTKWNTISSTPATSNYVIYGGSATQEWPQARLVNWRDAGTLVETLF